LFHPIFPSSTLVARSLLERSGVFDPRMRGLRPEDGEFTLRCLYKARAAAQPEALVSIRRHGGNFSADLAKRLVDEIAALHFIRQNHTEAAVHGAVIESEIARCTVQAFDVAFASRNHALVQQLYPDLPAARRTMARRGKRAIAALPDGVADRLNVLFQRIVSGTAGDKGGMIR
jgi:FMN phosphatase YigB (HAD superfamily)